jgi:hypothetical protein
LCMTRRTPHQPMLYSMSPSGAEKIWKSLEHYHRIPVAIIQRMLGVSWQGTSLQSWKHRKIHLIDGIDGAKFGMQGSPLKLEFVWFSRIKKKEDLWTLLNHLLNSKF